jgi:hypothetical protein
MFYVIKSLYLQCEMTLKVLLSREITLTQTSIYIVTESREITPTQTSIYIVTVKGNDSDTNKYRYCDRVKGNNSWHKQVYILWQSQGK